MTGKYILDATGHPHEEPDLTLWSNWFESADRTVCKTMVGDIRISTVFLGIDHSFGEGPPLFYETMIFGGERDAYQERYSTKSEAKCGHQQAVSHVQSDAAENDDYERMRRGE